MTERNAGCETIWIRKDRSGANRPCMTRQAWLSIMDRHKFCGLSLLVFAALPHYASRPRRTHRDHVGRTHLEFFARAGSESLKTKTGGGKAGSIRNRLGGSALVTIIFRREAIVASACFPCTSTGLTFGRTLLLVVRESSRPVLHLERSHLLFNGRQPVC